MDNLMHKMMLLRNNGFLADVDLAFCRLLKSISPVVQDEVLMAAALTSHAFRQGNVCISLQEYAESKLFENAAIVAPPLEEWVEKLNKSSLVGEPGSYRPLILDTANRLYLHKLWHYEQSLAHNILLRAEQDAAVLDSDRLRDGLNRFFGDSHVGETDWQKVAAIAALRNSFTVISGGPGTGKTTTVVKILGLLLEQCLPAGRQPSIALAAPTGKAAARLENSVLGSLQQLNTTDQVKDLIPKEAKTLHQLLGASRHRTGFRFNEDNPLPYDVVVVDEASMVDQALMSKLMLALLHDAKIILIGDKDQLASVEAGSVLGSICNRDDNLLTPDFAETLHKLSVKLPPACIGTGTEKLRDHIILLEKSYRFNEESGIPQLSASINRGRVEQTMELLQSESYKDITFATLETMEDVDQLLDQSIEDFIKPMLKNENPAQMFEILKTFHILSPHRRGPFGVEDINRRIEKALVTKGLISRYDEWYHGKPVIINRNDYTLGLNNGEVGICVKEGSEAPKIYFQQQQEFLKVASSRLPEHETAFALTVHKSQGSEFNRVLLMLPPRQSRVLSRELLYTAVTRAKESVQIAGTKKVLTGGIDAKLRRSSGLEDLLWSDRTNLKYHKH